MNASSTTQPFSASAKAQGVVLPPGLGHIQDQFQGSSEKLVIFIQDAHAVPEAQHSMRNIIENLSLRYGIRSVAVEGAEGPIDLTLFRSVPEKTILEGAFDRYLDAGELSGAVAAGVLSKTELQLNGLESWALYEEGVTEFLKALRSKPSLTGSLAALHQELDRLKSRYYSQEALAIDQRIRQLISDSANLPGILAELSQKLEPDQTHYPGLAAVLQLVEKDTEDYAQVLEREIQDLAGQVRQQLPDDTSVRDFNGKLQGWRTGQIAQADFADYLLRVAPDETMTAGLTEMIENHRKLSEIKGENFYGELQAYTKALKELVLKSAEEKSLDQLEQRIDRLDKLADLKLTIGEWEQIKSDKENVRNDESHLSAETSKPSLVSVDALQSKVDRLTASLTNHYSHYLRFYQIAERRDCVFVERIRQMLSGSDGRQSPTALIVVAGGFHTEGITSALRKENISYVTIAPQITRVPEGTKYLDAMQGRVSWRDYFRAENGRIDLYDAFARATVERMVRQSEGQAVKAGNQPALLKEWRDQLIRSMAARGNVAGSATHTQFLDRAAAKFIDPEKAKALKTEWTAKLDEFIRNLQGLETQGRLNEANVMDLLQQKTNMPPVMVPFSSRVPAQWFSPTQIAEFASETTRPEVRPSKTPPLSPRRKLAAKANRLVADALKFHDSIGKIEMVFNRIKEIRTDPVLAVAVSQKVAQELERTLARPADPPDDWNAFGAGPREWRIKSALAILSFLPRWHPSAVKVFVKVLMTQSLTGIFDYMAADAPDLMTNIGTENVRLVDPILKALPELQIERAFIGARAVQTLANIFATSREGAQKILEGLTQNGYLEALPEETLGHVLEGLLEPMMIKMPELFTEDIIAKILSAPKITALPAFKYLKAYFALRKGEAISDPDFPKRLPYRERWTRGPKKLLVINEHLMGQGDLIVQSTLLAAMKAENPELEIHLYSKYPNRFDPEVIKVSGALNQLPSASDQALDFDVCLHFGVEGQHPSVLRDLPEAALLIEQITKSPGKGDVFHAMEPFLITDDIRLERDEWTQAGMGKNANDVYRHKYRVLLEIGADPFAADTRQSRPLLKQFSREAVAYWDQSIAPRIPAQGGVVEIFNGSGYGNPVGFDNRDYGRQSFLGKLRARLADEKKLIVLLSNGKQAPPAYLQELIRDLTPAEQARIVVAPLPSDIPALVDYLCRKAYETGGSISTVEGGIPHFLLASRIPFTLLIPDNGLRNSVIAGWLNTRGSYAIEWPWERMPPEGSDELRRILDYFDCSYETAGYLIAREYGQKRAFANETISNWLKGKGKLSIRLHVKPAMVRLLYKRIGNYVRSFREALQLTPEQMAEVLKVSVEDYRQWEECDADGKGRLIPLHHLNAIRSFYRQESVAVFKQIRAVADLTQARFGEEIASRLREIRKRLNLPLDDRESEIPQMDQSYISHLENGNRPIPVDTLQAAWLAAFSRPQMVASAESGFVRRVYDEVSRQTRLEVRVRQTADWLFAGFSVFGAAGIIVLPQLKRLDILYRMQSAGRSAKNEQGERREVRKALDPDIVERLQDLARQNLIEGKTVTDVLEILRDITDPEDVSETDIRKVVNGLWQREQDKYRRTYIEYVKALKLYRMSQDNYRRATAELDFAREHKAEWEASNHQTWEEYEEELDRAASFARDFQGHRYQQMSGKARRLRTARTQLAEALVRNGVGSEDALQVFARTFPDWRMKTGKIRTVVGLAMTQIRDETRDAGQEGQSFRRAESRPSDPGKLFAGLLKQGVAHAASLTGRYKFNFDPPIQISPEKTVMTGGRERKVGGLASGFRLVLNLPLHFPGTEKWLNGYVFDEVTSRGLQGEAIWHLMVYPELFNPALLNILPLYFLSEKQTIISSYAQLDRRKVPIPLNMAKSSYAIIDLTFDQSGRLVAICSDEMMADVRSIDSQLLYGSSLFGIFLGLSQAKQMKREAARDDAQISDPLPYWQIPAAPKVDVAVFGNTEYVSVIIPDEEKFTVFDLESLFRKLQKLRHHTVNGLEYDSEEIHVSDLDSGENRSFDMKTHPSDIERHLRASLVRNEVRETSSEEAVDLNGVLNALDLSDDKFDALMFEDKTPGWTTTYRARIPEWRRDGTTPEWVIDAARSLLSREIGRYVRFFREALGYSVEEMAESLEVEAAEIRVWETKDAPERGKLIPEDKLVRLKSLYKQQAAKTLWALRQVAKVHQDQRRGRMSQKDFGAKIAQYFAQHPERRISFLSHRGEEVPKYDGSYICLMEKDEREIHPDVLAAAWQVADIREELLKSYVRQLMSAESGERRRELREVELLGGLGHSSDPGDVFLLNTNPYTGMEHDGLLEYRKKILDGKGRTDLDGWLKLETLENRLRLLVPLAIKDESVDQVLNRTDQDPELFRSLSVTWDTYQVLDQISKDPGLFAEAEKIASIHFHDSHGWLQVNFLTDKRLLSKENGATAYPITDSRMKLLALQTLLELDRMFREDKLMPDILFRSSHQRMSILLADHIIEERESPEEPAGAFSYRHLLDLSAAAKANYSEAVLQINDRLPFGLIGIALSDDREVPGPLATRTLHANNKQVSRIAWALASNIARFLFMPLRDNQKIVCYAPYEANELRAFRERRPWLRSRSTFSRPHEEIPYAVIQKIFEHRIEEGGVGFKMKSHLFLNQRKDGREDMISAYQLAIESVCFYLLDPAGFSETDPEMFELMQILIGTHGPRMTPQKSARVETAPAFLAQGEAADILDSPWVKRGDLTPDKTGPAFKEITDALDARIKKSKRKTLTKDAQFAKTVADHLQTQKIVGFDELRWEGSYAVGRIRPDQNIIEIGNGVMEVEHFRAEMLFRAGVESYLAAHPELAGADRQKIQHLPQWLFGDESEFSRVHREFVELTNDRYLESAIKRFDSFKEESPLYRTQDLFASWMEHDIRGQKHPVIEQAALLAKRIREKQWYLIKQNQPIAPAAADDDDGDTGRVVVRAFTKTTDSDRLQLYGTAYLTVLLPLLAFSLYRRDFFVVLDDVVLTEADEYRNFISSVAQTVVEQNEREALSDSVLGGHRIRSLKRAAVAASPRDEGIDFSVRTVLPEPISTDLHRRIEHNGLLSAVTRDTLETIVNWLVRECVDRYAFDRISYQDRQTSFKYAPVTMLRMTQPNGYTVEHLEQFQERLSRMLVTALLSDDRWAARNSIFYQTGNVIVPGLGRLTVAEREEIFSGGDGISSEPTELSPSEGPLKLQISAGQALNTEHGSGMLFDASSAVSQKISRHRDGRQIEYKIVRLGNIPVSTLFNPLMAQVTAFYFTGYYLMGFQYDAMLWQRIFSGLGEYARVWGLERDRDMHALWPLLFQMRQKLTPQWSPASGARGSAERSSHFAPDGADIGSWVDDLMSVDLCATKALFEAIWENFELPSHYMDASRMDLARLSLFWYYSQAATRNGVFAMLSEKLELAGGDNPGGRLTPQSQRLLLDALQVLYFSNGRSGSIQLGTRLLLKDIRPYLRLTPEGVSIPDLAAFKTFLTKFISDGPPISFDEWYERFYSEKGSDMVSILQDIAQLGKVAPNQDMAPRTRIFHSTALDEIEPDGDVALKLLKSVDSAAEAAFFDPEMIAADSMLAAVTTKSKQNPRAYQTVWDGTYQDGLPIPGSRHRFKLEGDFEGKVLRVTADKEHVTIEDPAADNGQRLLVDVPLDFLRGEIGEKGSTGQQQWQSVLNLEPFRKEIVKLQQKATSIPKLEGDGYYLVPLRGGDLFLCEHPRGILTAQITGLPEGQTSTAPDKVSVLVWKEGDTVKIYAADGSCPVGKMTYKETKSAEGPSGLEVVPVANRITRLDPPTLPVTGYLPASAEEAKQTNELARAMEPFMDSGKGYASVRLVKGRNSVQARPIAVETESADGADQNVFVIDTYYLSHSDELPSAVQNFLLSEDPVYEVTSVLDQLRRLIAEGREFEVETLPKYPAKQKRNKSWSDQGWDRYEAQCKAVRELHARLTAMRRIHSAYIALGAKAERLSIQDLPTAVSFQQQLRTLYREYDSGGFGGTTGIMIMNFHIWDPASQAWTKPFRTKLQCTDDEQQSGRKYQGLGIATRNNLTYSATHQRFQMSRRAVESRDNSLFIFIRYFEGEIETVKLFDIKNGKNPEDEEVEGRSSAQELARSIELIQESLRNAAAAAPDGNESLQTMTGEFFRQVADHAALTDRREIGHALENVSRALHFGGEFPAIVNLYTLEMIYRYVLHEPDQMVERARAMSQKIAQSDMGHFVIVLSLSLADAFEKVGFNPLEPGDDFETRFSAFAEEVLLPFLTGVDLSQNGALENAIGTILSMRDMIYSLLDQHMPGIVEEDGEVEVRQRLDQETRKEMRNAKAYRWTTNPDDLSAGNPLIKEGLRDGSTAAQTGATSLESYFVRQWIAEHQPKEEKKRSRPIEAEDLARYGVVMKDYDGVVAISVNGDWVLVDAERGAVRRMQGESLPGSIVKVMTHAHQDHFNGSAKLQAMFPGDIVMHPATSDWLARYAQGQKFSALAPLLEHNTIKADYYTPVKINDHAVLVLIPAGHLKGAAAVLLITDRGNILHTGDFSVDDLGSVKGLPQEIILPHAGASGEGLRIPIDVALVDATLAFMDDDRSQPTRETETLTNIREGLSGVLRDREHVRSGEGAAVVLFASAGIPQHLYHLIRSQEDLAQVPLYAFGPAYAELAMQYGQQLSRDPNFYRLKLEENEKIVPALIEQWMQSHKNRNRRAIFLLQAKTERTDEFAKAFATNLNHTLLVDYGTPDQYVEAMWPKPELQSLEKVTVSYSPDPRYHVGRSHIRFVTKAHRPYYGAKILRMSLFAHDLGQRTDEWLEQIRPSHVVAINGSPDARATFKKRTKQRMPWIHVHAKSASQNQFAVLPFLTSADGSDQFSLEAQARQAALFPLVMARAIPMRPEMRTYQVPWDLVGIKKEYEKMTYWSMIQTILQIVRDNQDPDVRKILQRVQDAAAQSGIDAWKAVYMAWQIHDGSLDNQAIEQPQWCKDFDQVMRQAWEVGGKSGQSDPEEWAARMIGFLVKTTGLNLAASLKIISFLFTDEDLSRQMAKKYDLIDWAGQLSELVVGEESVRRRFTTWKQSFKDFLSRFVQIESATPAARQNRLARTMKQEIISKYQSHQLPAGIARQLSEELNLYLNAGERIDLEIFRAELRQATRSEVRLVAALAGLDFVEAGDVREVLSVKGSVAGIRRRLSLVLEESLELLLGRQAFAEMADDRGDSGGIYASVEQAMRDAGVDPQDREQIDQLHSAADREFEAGLEKLVNQIHSGEITRMAPVIFYQPGMEKRLSRFVRAIYDAFSERGDVTGENFRVFLVAEDRHRDAFRKFAAELKKISAGEAVMTEVLGVHASDQKRLARNLAAKIFRPFEGHYSLFFAPQDFLKLLDQVYSKRVVRNEAEQTEKAEMASVLIPGIAAYCAVTSNKDMTDMTLRQQLPDDYSSAVQYGADGTLMIFVSKLIDVFAKAARQFEASA